MENKTRFLPSLVSKIKYSRKVKVTDIKQYLVDEFNLVKQLETENKELHNLLEQAKELEDKYNLTLVTLEEYKARIETKKIDILELRSKIKQFDAKNKTLTTERNDLLLANKRIEREFENKQNCLINHIKQDLIELIKEQKGTLSKRKIIELIENFEGM